MTVDKTVLRQRDGSNSEEGSFTVRFTFRDGTSYVMEADRMRLLDDMGVWEVTNTEAKPLLVRTAEVVGVEIDGYARD